MNKFNNLIFFMRSKLYKTFFLKYILEINRGERSFHLYSNHFLKKISLYNKEADMFDGKNSLVLFFTIYKEVCKRLLLVKPRKNQLEGSLASCHNFLAQIGTGQGKTISLLGTALWKTYTTSNIIHIVSSNDYLVTRDHIYSLNIVSFYNLRSCTILENTLIDELKDLSYSRIIYSTVQSLGFSFLKNVVNPISRFHYIFDTIIIDEIDTLLYETLQVPLSISYSHNKENFKKYIDISKIFKESFLGEKKIYENVLTDSVIESVELHENNDSRYTQDIASFYWLYIKRNLYTSISKIIKGLDYLVKGSSIILLDSNTGRPMHQHKLSNGLQEAIEVKENLLSFKNNDNSYKLNLIDLLDLYKKVLGFSATLGQEINLDILNRNFIIYSISDSPTKISFLSIKLERIFFKPYNKDWIFYRKNKKQPLVIYQEALKSDRALSKFIKVPDLSLNALNIEYEKKYLSKAGRYNQVLTATNIISRGTNISLGSSRDSFTEKSIIQMLGGIYLLYFDSNKSTRFIDQLEGRVGRQSRSGESRIIYSYNVVDTNMQSSALQVKKSRIFDFNNQVIANVSHKLFLDLIKNEEGELLSKSLSHIRSSNKGNIIENMYLLFYINNFISKPTRVKSKYLNYIEQKTTYESISTNIFKNKEIELDMLFILNIHTDRRWLKSLYSLQFQVSREKNISVYSYHLLKTYKDLFLRSSKYKLNQKETIFIQLFLEYLNYYEQNIKTILQVKGIPTLSLNRDADSKTYTLNIFHMLIIEDFYNKLFFSNSVKRNRVYLPWKK